MPRSTPKPANSDAGQVEVRWTQADDNLLLQWSERGGPRIETAPAAQGFGSILMRNTVDRQFGGTIDHAWLRDGLVVTISLPVAGLSG
jgi:two-component sensor histidine kinase